MDSLLLPIVLCILLWWLGTGLVLRLNQTEGAFGKKQLVATLLMAVLAMGVVIWSLNLTTVFSAVLGFSAGIVLWGCLEIAHYSGLLVGPRTERCPIGVSPVQRFRYAFNAMFYHELAVAGMGALIIFITTYGENKAALYTYLVLWLMRISTELNIFFGVSNFPEHWLPRQLQYLGSYRHPRSFNYFFPASFSLGVIVCVWVFLQVPTALENAHERCLYLLLGTLLVLGVIEHLVLVVPIKLDALWAWAGGKLVARQS